MVLISMKEEWRCVLLTSGEQYVVTLGTAMMQLWSARTLDMLSLMVHGLDNSSCINLLSYYTQLLQQEQMRTLVLVLVPSIWLM